MFKPSCFLACLRTVTSRPHKKDKRFLDMNALFGELLPNFKLEHLSACLYDYLFNYLSDGRIGCFECQSLGFLLCFLFS